MNRGRGKGKGKKEEEKKGEEEGGRKNREEGGVKNGGGKIGSSNLKKRPMSTVRRQEEGNQIVNSSKK